ncbi:hypothetical protein Tco_1322073, partial [Tanacetum coccineum]
GTCSILLTLKKLIEDMLPLEVTPKEVLEIRGFFNLMLLVPVCAAAED